MKNYIILFLIMLLFLTSSFLFKASKENRLTKFPEIEGNSLSSQEKTPFYLYIFFSEKSCVDCLGILKEIESLSDYYEIYGVLPDEEFNRRSEIKNRFGFNKKFIKASKLNEFSPLYWPSIIGVKSGEVYFVLPSIPNSHELLKEYLERIFYKFLY